MNIQIKKIYLWFIVFSFTITYGLNFFHSPDSMYEGVFVQRQYGNAFTINVFTILIFAGFIILSVLNKKLKFVKDMYPFCLVFFVLTGIFPNNQQREFTLYAIYALIKYLLLFIILISLYNFQEFKKIITKSFKAVLIFETIIGVLQVFFSIKIPYISSWSTDSVRNGLVRMAGTFASGPDFSLVVTFLTCFFLVQYFYGPKKNTWMYVVISLFDIWLAGSRTMIITIAIIILYLYLKKNKNHIFSNLLLFVIITIMICIIPFTSVYQEMFVNNNIKDMFLTRFVHWSAAFQVIKDNWLMGVGLNNSVTYIQNHPLIISIAYENSLENMGFYYTNPIHNSILLVFSECGMIGGIMYLGIYIKLILNSFKKLNMDTAMKRNSDYLFVFCATIIWLIYALQGWGTLKEHSWIMFTLLYTYFVLLEKEQKQLSKIN